MYIVYAGESFVHIRNTIFLAGPTPRSSAVMDGFDGEPPPSWRPKAIRYLKRFGYNGNVFVPEPRQGYHWPKYDDQLNWENECLTMADCILFWIPREMRAMPGLTTNDEWGQWKDSGKCVLGVPRDAQKVRYQIWWARKLHVPLSHKLKHTVMDALDMVGFEYSSGRIRHYDTLGQAK